ncbi:MAG: YdcF family protein [Clostridiales bacterium]|nr:YdcF family protein [Clostridiales bacterium]
MKTKIKKKLRTFLKFILICFILASVTLLSLNLLVCLSSKNRMISVEDSPVSGDYECIIVLGCGVNGEDPSALLSDRLDAAVELYHSGAAPKILMSGDHGREDYDEVNVMRQYAIDRGVPSEDIFMDHAGFSTYETMYRAKNIFGIDSAVIVTQEYHLYRALYDASSLGIDSVGTIAVGHKFFKMPVWEAREVLARVKDVLWCIFKPAPTYMGDSIDISGNGEVTLG